jgi:hypothetical protein
VTRENESNKLAGTRTCRRRSERNRVSLGECEKGGRTLLLGRSSTAIIRCGRSRVDPPTDVFFQATPEILSQVVSDVSATRTCQQLFLTPTPHSLTPTPHSTRPTSDSSYPTPHTDFRLLTPHTPHPTPHTPHLALGPPPSTPRGTTGTSSSRPAFRGCQWIELVLSRMESDHSRVGKPNRSSCRPLTLWGCTWHLGAVPAASWWP